MLKHDKMKNEELQNIKPLGGTFAVYVHALKSIADKSFLLPMIQWGSQSCSDQITFSPKIDQSCSVAVFASAFCGN